VIRCAVNVVPQFSQTLSKPDADELIVDANSLVGRTATSRTFGREPDRTPEREVTRARSDSRSLDRGTAADAIDDRRHGRR